MNKLYYGDNLEIMRRMPKYCVDLVYLDPPFSSKKNYNIMYKTMTGLPVPEQVEAFCDTWVLDAEKMKTAKELPILLKEYGVDEYYRDFWRIWVNALRYTQPHLLAYLIYMVERLVHLKVILKPTGSIYLHCDPTASHYIKVMMDGIFGHGNFRNEIIWKRTFAHGSANRWGDIHDTLLFYSISDSHTWNRTEQALDPDYIIDKYRFEDGHGRYQEIVLTGPGTTKGDSGKPWGGYDPTAAGRHWAVPRRALKALRGKGIETPEKIQDQLELLHQRGYIRIPTRRDGTTGAPRYKLYLTSGQPIQDMILDIPPINSQAKERLGYPTQKPIALLNRIIRASSNKGDVIFDPFCGCGTTVYAAHEAGRNWIGCDVAILPIKLIKRILEERYRLAEGKHFEIDGIPFSVEQAQHLFKRDPFQFQHWFVERVGGFPMLRKVADRGIDGRIYFETKDTLLEMVLSVKGGMIRPSDIRDLRGVLERESNAAMAGFLSLKAPTKAMLAEAAQAGMFEYMGVSYERLQFLTVANVLEEKKEFHTPTRIGMKGETGQVNIPI